MAPLNLIMQNMPHHIIMQKIARRAEKAKEVALKAQREKEEARLKQKKKLD